MNVDKAKFVRFTEEELQKMLNGGTVVHKRVGGSTVYRMRDDENTIIVEDD